MSRAAIILAAGAGTRMKSKKPKVAHCILGRPLVQWVCHAAKDAGVDKLVAVVGHKKEQVIPLVEEDCDIVIQQQQAGTADAVMTGLSAEALEGFEGSVVILSGDSPLITSDTIKALIDAREQSGAACALLTMELEDPFGYGRIIRSSSISDQSVACDGEYESSRVLRIVEQKDGSEEELLITECNSGFYCFDAALLREALRSVSTDNAQGEYYLTDVAEILGKSGYLCIAVKAEDPEECLGVNSRVQLSVATTILQSRINVKWMKEGVTMVSPVQTWIGPDVELSEDVELLPNVALLGKTTVGTDCVIGPDSRLTDTQVGERCIIDETVAVEAIIEDDATCGPRAYLRPGAHLMKGSKAGTHVEIKKSVIDEGAKVPHLSYIGDAHIGKDVNLGAGTITCNYDGQNKHHTEVGDNTFVGSDTMLVAPVNIGSDVVIGAGSVITKDIPDGSLAVARSRERIIDDWARRKKFSKE